MVQDGMAWYTIVWHGKVWRVTGAMGKGGGAVGRSVLLLPRPESRDLAFGRWSRLQRHQGRSKQLCHGRGERGRGETAVAGILHLHLHLHLHTTYYMMLPGTGIAYYNTAFDFIRDQRPCVLFHFRFSTALLAPHFIPYISYKPPSCPL